MSVIGLVLVKNVFGDEKNVVQFVQTFKTKSTAQRRRRDEMKLKTKENQQIGV